MKNLFQTIFIILSFTLLTENSFGQRTLPNPYANDLNLPPVIQPKDLMITGFISYPNWEAYLVNLLLDNNNNVNTDLATVGGIAPIGLRIEHSFTSIFSITLDAFYNSMNAEFIENGFKSKIVSNRTRILIGFNYHIPDLNVEKLDLYGGLALGANTRSIKVTSENPDFQQNNYLPGRDNPLSFRFRLGGRYFFTDNIGLNVELGLGGPLMSFGLTYRMIN